MILIKITGTVNLGLVTQTSNTTGNLYFIIDCVKRGLLQLSIVKKVRPMLRDKFTMDNRSTSSINYPANLHVGEASKTRPRASALRLPR